MKLHESPSPNARRVHIAMAEKSIEIERVAVDIRAGENISAEYLAKNPGGRVPMLELDDGTFIGESVSITRYLDAIGEGPSLFGDSPLAQAQIDMWQRRAEFNFLLEVAGAFRNITGFFKDRETCVEAWGVVCAEKAPKALTMFDDQLAQTEFCGRSILSRGYYPWGGSGLCSFGEGGRAAGTCQHQALAGQVESTTEFFGELTS